jgi:hypothetical protein
VVDTARMAVNTEERLPSLEEALYDRIVSCSFCHTERHVSSIPVGVGSEGECPNPNCNHNLGWHEVNS